MKEEKNNKGRTPCTVWSRVVGYMRSTDTWNDGKVAEFEDRKMFVVESK